jgi:hypothetical protein
MSNAVGQTQDVMCPKCGYVFSTAFTSHCNCKGCGVAISVPSARAVWINLHSARVSNTPAPLPADLGPVHRDEHGQPLPKPARANKSDTPRHDHDWFASVRKRLEEFEREKGAKPEGAQ